MTRDLARMLTRAPIPLIDIAVARDDYATFRGQHGAKAVDARLLSAPDENVKLDKSLAPTWSLALAQAAMSIEYNVCRFSTAGCRAGCVADAGKGGLDSVKAGRRRKTLFLAENPSAFMTKLVHELGRIEAKDVGAKVRLNAFSDIDWENVRVTTAGGTFTLFELFPGLSFYDYTKWTARVTPANYHLTRSATERWSVDDIANVCATGTNVAVVLSVKRGHALPLKYNGVRVVDGDKSDDRTLDPRGVIVGLRAKGVMRNGNAMVFS